jgi:uncharacterized protein YjlB
LLIVFLIFSYAMSEPAATAKVNPMKPTYSNAGDTKVSPYLLTDDGVFPNNANCPLLVYPQALALSSSDPAARFESLFTQNHWPAAWRNGIYGFHHYHSSAHEVLGVFSGSARVQFGGENGIVLEVRACDVVVIPAGVSHKNLGASRNFGVAGAYPKGQKWDMQYGKPGERPAAEQRIARVPMPLADPVFGVEGPLCILWKTR